MGQLFSSQAEAWGVADALNDRELKLRTSDVRQAQQASENAGHRSDECGVDDVPGFAKRPMGRADVERKFHANVDSRWPRERTEALLATLWTLENARLAPLLDGLSLSS